MVFHYLDVFGREEDGAEIEAMKEQYQRGGLGDVKTKRYLLDILGKWATRHGKMASNSASEEGARALLEQAFARTFVGRPSR